MALSGATIPLPFSSKSPSPSSPMVVRDGGGGSGRSPSRPPSISSVAPLPPSLSLFPSSPHPRLPLSGRIDSSTSAATANVSGNEEVGVAPPLLIGPPPDPPTRHPSSSDSESSSHSSSKMTVLPSPIQLDSRLSSSVSQVTVPSPRVSPSPQRRLSIPNVSNAPTHSLSTASTTNTATACHERGNQEERAGGGGGGEGGGESSGIGDSEGLLGSPVPFSDESPLSSQFGGGGLSVAVGPLTSSVPHPYAPQSPSGFGEVEEKRRVPEEAVKRPSGSGGGFLLLSSSSSRSLSPTSLSTSASLDPSLRSSPPLPRRTLPSSVSSALPRLPFFFRGPSSGVPVSPTKATTTAAGPAGYLASLDPTISTSPRTQVRSMDSWTPPTPSGRSNPLLSPATRHSPLRSSESAAKKGAFFASVALALGRMSISQKAGAAQPTNEGRRPSIATRAGLPLKVSAAAATPTLTLSDMGDEVTALSPRFLNAAAVAAAAMTGDGCALSTPPVCISASAPSPSQCDAPCPFFHGVLPGVYSHLPFQPSYSSSNSCRPPFPVPVTPLHSRMSQRLLESWSESDDPLSPASFQEIVPSVFLGSAKSALNIDRLLEHRITHILTVMHRPLNFLATSDDATDADQLSFGGTKQWESTKQSIRLPSHHPMFLPLLYGVSVNFVYLLDVPEADLLSALDESLPFLSYAEQHQRGRVLIHCQAGISRSASVVIAYLVHRFGWTVKEAWERCGEVRPYINPNDGFISQLDLFKKAEERKQRRERKRWQELRKKWTATSHAGKRLLQADTERHLRPKALPTEARKPGEEDQRRHGGTQSARVPR